MTPAGWYRDPYGNPGLLRWWDGYQWTEATRPTGAGQQTAWDWSSAPPTWAQTTAAPPAGRRSRLPFLVGGGAAALIIVAVVVILFAANVFGGGNGGRSPVTGTITDAQAGISYSKLGGKWRGETIAATTPLGKLGFDQGEIAQVMADFQNGRPYLASAYSGAAIDTTSAPLETKAKAILTTLEPVAYPAHTRQDLTSASHPLDGHDGWLLKVRFAFPEAKSHGWNFRTETAAIVIIDRGSGRSPAEFYVSIPDSHGHQGDLDLLLSSLKVS